MSNELEWNTIEQILKFVKYDHTKEDFCAFIPDNHVIISGKNKAHTINQLRLYQNSDNTTITIGNIDFYCDLLTRKEDNCVLLKIDYKDSIFPNNKKINDIQKKRLCKYIESLLLGFDRYGKDFEYNPNYFFDNNNKIDLDDEW